MAYFDQQRSDIRCEWGAQGLANLAQSDVVVIVDVLSFTTSVEIAVSRGVSVLPYPPGGDSVQEYADAKDALLAARRTRQPGELSLSPASLINADAGIGLVLPSPNGSALSFSAAESGAVVVAGCLRNASAVAAWADATSRTVTVIPAGERWEDRSLRPAFEDLVGAGAVINSLQGKRSPEAGVAVAAFIEARSMLVERLRDCSSGRELTERGFEQDVQLAAQLDVSDTVPVLESDAFTRADTTPAATGKMKL